MLTLIAAAALILLAVLLCLWIATGEDDWWMEP